MDQDMGPWTTYWNLSIHLTMISTHNTRIVSPIPPLLDASVLVSRNFTSNTSKCISPSPTTLNSWDRILAASKSELPPPGPDHYAARRKLWLTPRHIVEPSPIEPSTSRQRLEKLLSFPDAAESDEVWSNGLDKVWKGLNEGGRFKRRLPMALIVC
jgi:hypothetical protein